MAETRAQQENFQILLMKALDHELNEKDSAEFEKMLEASLDYKQEYEAMKKVRNITREMHFCTPTDAVWDRYWTGVYNCLERGIGWIIFSIGAVILLTYGAFRFVESVIANTHLTIILKAGILLVLGGLFTLLVSVIREKFFLFKRDPYKEIQR
ncbi:hypothetical protein JW948_11250 [bacterium]|nr:hypothetical protein [bacterium]